MKIDQKLIKSAAWSFLVNKVGFVLSQMTKNCAKWSENGAKTGSQIAKNQIKIDVKNTIEILVMF